MVVQSEQLDDRCHIVLTFDVVTDPARFWMQVVQRCLAGGHELLADADGYWEVRETVSMEVPDLPTADVKKDHPLAVGVHSHVGP